MSDQGLFTMVHTPDGEFRFTPVAPAPASNIKMLDVPWLPQNGLQVMTDDYSNSDCGTACLGMALRSRGKMVTVDEVSKETGLPAGFKYTVPADLIKAAAKFDLPLGRFVGGAPDAIICHDPYWPDSRGANVAMLRAAFEKAWTDSTVDGNQARQGLRL